MYNTIIFWGKDQLLTSGEYKKFEKHSELYGEKIKTWQMEEKDEALKELAKHKCKYYRALEGWHIEEYWLEYCEYDEDGEFVEGSDIDFAEDEIEESEESEEKDFEELEDNE